MLGEPVLIGRDAAGVPFALRDSARIAACGSSAGSFDGHEVECCYHGWRFDTGGPCTAIPSLVPGQAFTPSACGSAPTRRARCRAISGCSSATTRGRRRRFRFWPGSAIAVPQLFERCSFAAAHRPRRRRADGPGAWTVRPPRLVVALAPLDPGKAKAFTASPWGFTMQPPRAFANSQRLSAPWAGLGDRDRLPPAERARRAHPSRPPPRLQSDRDDPDRRPDEPRSIIAIYWTAPWLSALKPLLRPYRARLPAPGPRHHGAQAAGGCGLQPP